jgi:four helix bundle protein
VRSLERGVRNSKREAGTNSMNNENLKLRTKQFALRVIKLVESLPGDGTSAILGRQLLRAGTSVGTNYRAACRSKSAADFVSKMGTVEEEADESGYWMELLVDAGKVKAEKASALVQEAGELTAIAVSSINTARKSPSFSFHTPHSVLRT